VDAYDEFWDGVRHMGTMPIQDFCNSENADVRKHYFAVRKYLNVRELIAVGIKNGMFDGRTCYDFWSRILIRCVEAARPRCGVLDQRYVASSFATLTAVNSANSRANFG
jgi:Domain of unknown function (DUF4760)